MPETPLSAIVEYFSALHDPRRYNRRHVLLDILTIAICGVICGADDWPAVEEFGQAKQDWFKEFLDLRHGVPSQYTFRRVFECLDADRFEACFVQWVRAIQTATQGQVVAVDGKKLRRSHDRLLGKEAIYVVSAWAAENRLVLGEVKVDEQSNEITAVPELLEMLDLSGCVVTADALNCQKAIAEQVVEQGADYVLSVKENQRGLYEAMRDLFEYAEGTGFVDCDYHKVVDKDHGRIEIRECWTTSNPDYLLYVTDRSKWAGLRTLAWIRSQCQRGEERTVRVSYRISSLQSDAERILNAVRGHWGIENEVHWVLDIAFREDESRLRKGNGAYNFALLRRLALNLLKRERTARCGIKGKRLKAGWDHNYLLKVLEG
jgi:predicted transposase YbfD/YdcC